MKKTIIISVLLLLIPFINVSATSLMDYNAVGYGFTYMRTNNTMASYSWQSYNIDYLQRDMSDFPSDVSHFGILLEDIGIRFRIDGGFKKDHNYIITFEWTNYDNEYDNSWSFYDQYIQVGKQWTCRTDSWSGTSQSESTCFVAGNYSEKQKLTNNSILITIHFTAKIDMYGMTIYWDNRNNVNNAIYSQGWSIGPVSYEDISDESQAVIDNATQNANNIINNQNTNTQNIINNQNTNTQNIINNQNSNTQAIIDSNKTCKLIDKNYIETDNYYLTASGTLNPSNDYGVTGYFSTTGSEFTVNDVFSGANYCTYGPTKFIVQCYANSSMTVGQKLTFPDTVKYVRFTIKKAQNKPQIKMCQNGSQAVVDSLTDETPPDSAPISNSVGWLPPGPVDSILNLPLSLLTNISNNLGGTCVPVTVTLPFVNENLTLPCLSSIYTEIDTAGNTTTLATFLTWFGTLVSGLILYKYLLNLYNWVEYVLTFRAINQMARWGGV